MTPDVKGKERRQHTRYDITGGAFALLKWNGSELLGSIKDISAGGFSLSHIDDNEGLRHLAMITIDLISEKTYHENLVGRNIWSKKEAGGFTTAMVKMKRCGIEFVELNKDTQLQLDTFIDSVVKK